MSSLMHTLDLHDYIGGESCFDFAPDVANTPSRTTTRQSRPRRHAVEKEYPPPIHRLPRVLKKYTTSDGRVLLKEEKAERQHYIRAHRSDGRLLLDLVEELNFDGEDDNDLTVEDREEERCAYSEMGVNPCGGFGLQPAFGPAVRT